MVYNLNDKYSGRESTADSLLEARADSRFIRNKEHLESNEELCHKSGHAFEQYTLHLPTHIVMSGRAAMPGKLHCAE